MAPEQFNDDIQGILVDEVKQILKGKLNKHITEDHILAVKEEHRQFLESLKPLQQF